LALEKSGCNHRLMTAPKTVEATSPTSAFDWVAARGEKWRDQLDGMEATLAPIDEPLIEALVLERSYRIADLGCGGGGTTLEVLRRAPLGSIVHGFDVSPALIESARARTPADERALAFAQVDVSSAAAVPDQPYDRLLSRFGIMFYDDPTVAFANLSRWLAPGGRFAFAVWGRPADNAWTSLVRDAAAEVIDLPMPDPDAPGPFRYAETSKLLALLDRAGFAGLDVRDWRGNLPIGGGLPAAEAAEFALRSSSTGELVCEAGEKTFDRVRDSLATRFAQHRENGAVRLSASVQIVTGVRAGFG